MMGRLRTQFAQFTARRSAVFLFFTFVAFVYFAFFGRALLESVSYPTWLIAPIMALGSFVAGSTFLGGGAVAFPALTKLLTADPTTAKTFSLAIQSVGMSAASMYIISRTRSLPFAFILLYSASSAVGLFCSLTFFEHSIEPADLRVGFTLFLLCFLVVYLLTRDSKNTSKETHLERNIRDLSLTVFCGYAGGSISGLLGSGADLIAFCLLALYFRIEIIRATQISVIVMALTSITGVVIQAGVYDRVSEEVLSYWVIAAPVVLFGAPIGAIFCRKISSNSLLYFISLIVAVEAISTYYLVPIQSERLLYYALAVTIFTVIILFFHHQASIKHD